MEYMNTVSGNGIITENELKKAIDMELGISPEFMHNPESDWSAFKYYARYGVSVINWRLIPALNPVICEGIKIIEFEWKRCWKRTIWDKIKIAVMGELSMFKITKVYYH